MEPDSVLTKNTTMDMANKRVVIISGSRGIGYGFVEYYLEKGAYVITSCRNLDAGNSVQLKTLYEKYKKSGQLKIINEIDITDANKRKIFASNIKNNIDLLILSAGIKGYSTPGMKPHEHTTEEMNQAFKVNTLAHTDLINLLSDKLLEDSAVVVTSSGVSSILDNGSGGYHPYRVSKVMINRIFAYWRNYFDRKAGMIHRPRLITIAPGWVKTDMGGNDARLSVKESVTAMAEKINLIIKKQCDDNRLILYNGDSVEAYKNTFELNNQLVNSSINSVNGLFKKIDTKEEKAVDGTGKVVVFINLLNDMQDYHYKMIEQYLKNNFKVLTHCMNAFEENETLKKLHSDYSERLIYVEKINLICDSDRQAFINIINKSHYIDNIDYLIFNTLEKDQFTACDLSLSDPMTVDIDALSQAFNRYIIVPDDIIRQLFNFKHLSQNTAVVYMNSILSSVKAYRSDYGNYTKISVQTAANMMIYNWLHEFLSSQSELDNIDVIKNIPIAFAICPDANTNGASEIEAQIINQVIKTIEKMKNTKNVNGLLDAQGKLIETYKMPQALSTLLQQLSHDNQKSYAQPRL